MPLQIRKPTLVEIQKIFLIFSAFNAFGYNEENNRKGMSSIRKRVRKELRGYKWDAKYHLFKQEIAAHHPWHLIHTVLMSSVKSKNPFIINFNKFSREPKIRNMWKNYRKHYLQEMRSLAPLFAREARQIIKFVEKPPRIIKQLLFIPNPLDAYWRGYSLLIRGTGYVIAGPGAMDHAAELIRHELFHLLAPRLRLPLQLVSLKRHQHIVKQSYGDRNILAREYVVRAMNLLYERKVLRKDINDVLTREAKEFPRIRQVLTILEKKRSHF